MSILAVAKKDFRDAVRSRELWILMGLFVLFLPVVALYDARAGSSVEDGLPFATLFATALVMVFI